MGKRLRIGQFARAALIMLLALPSYAGADPMPRRLDFGWTLGEPAAGGVGVEVKRVVPGGGADRAGVHAGDVVLQVAGLSAASDQGISAFRFTGNPRRPVNVQLLRGPEHLAVRVLPLAAVREDHPGIDTVPTLVVWGEFDWIMDRADQEQIVRLVNGDGVQRAELFVVPGADHNFGRHPDRQSAFDHNGDGSYPAESGQRIIDFIRKINAVNP